MCQTGGENIWPCIATVVKSPFRILFLETLRAVCGITINVLVLTFLTYRYFILFF